MKPAVEAFELPPHLLEKGRVMSKSDKLQDLNSLNPADVTICETTQKMLAKAHRDGVETAFDRAANMKACPIGEKSACCKHCAMGPCRLNAKDPYSKVGVCGATIDTIQSRNFARMVASGTASHTDHGMEMLNLFKGVVSGHIKDYEISDTEKLIQVAGELGIATEDREVLDIARDLCAEMEKTYTQIEGELPFIKRAPKKTQEMWREAGVVPRAPCARSWRSPPAPTWAWTRTTPTSSSRSTAPPWPTAGAAPWWPPKSATCSSAPPTPWWAR